VSAGNGVPVGTAVLVGKAAVGVTAVVSLHPTSRGIVAISTSKRLIIS